MTPPATGRRSGTTTEDAGRPRNRAGFGARLLVAQTLVLGAGALTTWIVASAVGPGIFRDHLEMAGDPHPPGEVSHLEQAFAAALLWSIGLAVFAALAAALAASWYISRRVQRSIGTVTDAAEDIAAGRLGTRAPPTGLGTEFDTLADGYNSLATRLEAVETTRRRMLADLAHEMRTPLATVDAHLEAVEDGVRELDEATLEVIRSSTARLRRLAEDISAVSRAEEGVVETALQLVDAGSVARTAAAAARHRYADKGVELVIEADEDLRACVDAERIGQVLTNLLDNALRHTPPGGTVTLVCDCDDRTVQYVVSDTGEGIGAEHLPHVFDRFYRADTARDRVHGGSGIGLAISRALVEAHGGTIAVESAGAGRGATFTVRLPSA